MSFFPQVSPEFIFSTGCDVINGIVFQKEEKKDVGHLPSLEVFAMA
jgi:hypothetical protein